ncbi:hypothetical protein [Alkalihalobacillus deserti]|uniref:hypothetical protein n=1 Tax=Alkalihalobacillus deserti TaxID=2879466 RepID=UPI001D1481A2|nr:hypothetical protein [Alkalihalobacillus deserti]
MASIYSAIKCPYCGRSAIEDFNYTSDEKYISCIRCGYNYTKILKEGSNDLNEFEEDSREGHGVFSLMKKDGKREMRLFNHRLSNDALETYKRMFLGNSVDQEKSYLIMYEDEIFSIVLGSPSENFYLSFEEYKEKMFKKYGNNNDFEFIVPIEE